MNLKEKYFDAIVLGTSAGGIEVIKKILSSLNPSLSIPIIIVIHIARDGSNLLPDIFSDDTHYRVKEAEPGEALTKNTVYFAPADYHLSIETKRTLSLSNEEEVFYSRPSIDVLFESAAMAFGKRILALLCTGANQDGALGAKKIFEKGGTVIVQDPTDSDFPTMPESALALFHPTAVLPVAKIQEALKSL